MGGISEAGAEKLEEITETTTRKKYDRDNWYLLSI